MATMKKHGRSPSGMFARLIGLGKRAADKDDCDDCAEGEDGDEDAEDEEEDKGDAKKGKKAKKAKSKAKDDDGEEDAEDDDGEDKAEDDEADEDAEDDDDREKAAARRERRRCAAIIAEGVKLGAVEQAGVMAFDSNMSAKAAISVLRVTGKVDGPKGRRSLDQRMSRVSVPKVGSDNSDDAGGSDGNEASAIAKRMTGVYAKITGGK